MLPLKSQLRHISMIVLTKSFLSKDQCIQYRDVSSACNYHFILTNQVELPFFPIVTKIQCNKKKCNGIYQKLIF